MVLCYDERMQKNTIEPGLLRAFRLFALLRIAVAVISYFLVNTFPAINELFHEEALSDFNGTVLFTISTMLMLLGYLSWPWLECKLGRSYLPLALVLSTLWTIIEQYLYVSYLSNQAFQNVGQLIPFLYILLIIVAWQYSYRWVVVYTLGTLLFEAANILIVSPPIGPIANTLQEPYTYAAGLVTRVFSFLVLGYVITWLMKAQRLNRQELSKANLKLVQYSTNIEQLSISRERNRLSRELHDTLAHTLSALAVQFEVLLAAWESNPNHARSIAEQMGEMTKKGLDETRRSLHNLRASPLEDLGLVLAIKELSKEFASRNNLSLNLDIPESMNDIPPEIEQCFYRIAQESLENIARHANADELTIQLMRYSSGLSMSITDNGRGFDISDDVNRENLGIQGMAERADLIGGVLTVDSQPGRDTTVKLVWVNEK